MVIDVRADMELYADALGRARLPATKWRRVKPPQYHEGERLRRYVTGWQGLESWSTCPVPLAVALHERFRQRWEIEAAFMALTRY